MVRVAYLTNIATNQNLNNNPEYNIMMATQEDYDRIRARIDKANATLDDVSEGFAQVRKMLRSK